MANHFKDLDTWQKAMNFVEKLYRYTANFPTTEMYGLTSQLRRAAISIPSNIAEGAERDSTKDFLRFISMARGSHGEVETQLILAHRITKGAYSQTGKYMSSCHLPPVTCH